MKKIILIILFVGVALLLSTCYKEGGNAFLEKRKIYGKKYITLFTVDGIDSLKYLEDSVFQCKDYALDFTNNKTDRSGEPGTEGAYNLIIECGGKRIYPCQFPSWGKNLKTLSFITIDDKGGDCDYMENNCRKYRNQVPSPLCGGWSITKLTWKELWIEQEKNNHKYIVHFKEKK